MTTAAQAKSKPKKTAASKKTLSHPPFAEMITDAIVSLKERTGSSQYAITKFIEGKHKELPPTFRKLVLHQLKKLVAADKLVKVKNSFKLAPTRTAPAKTTTASAPAAAKKPKAVSKPSAKAPSKPKPKPKAAAKPAAKPKAKPAKAASAKKAVAKPAKKVPVKSVKKPKSVKSPAKKAKK